MDNRKKGGMYAGDLFNNPMVNSSLKNMTSEQVKYYRDEGKKMYADLPDDNEEPRKGEVRVQCVNDAVLYIESGLRSGLLPSSLDDGEKTLMREIHGDKWYTKFGFSEKDL